MTPSVPDAVFSELPFVDQLMLWAVRLWMRGMQDGHHDLAILGKGFELAGVPGAHTVLDGFLTIVTTSATAAVDIRAPRCGGVSADEQTLMTAMGTLQAPDDETTAQCTQALFADRLPPAARRLAVEWAGRLAEMFADAGLIIGGNNTNRDRSFPTAATRMFVGPSAVTIH